MTYFTETMPAGAGTFTVRSGTSDSSVVMSTFDGDEYRLRGRKFAGWAIDLGAHIGVIAGWLLENNPDLSVIAIEPLPENLDLCKQNLARYGERAVVVQGAAGVGEFTTVGYEFGGIDADEDYLRSNHFIGKTSLTGEKVPTVSLEELVTQFGDIALVKTDCEGGEFPFFADPAANAHVDVIVGEFHDAGGPLLRRLLGPTHDFVRWEPVDDGEVTGIFEAVRRD